MGIAENAKVAGNRAACAVNRELEGFNEMARESRDAHSAGNAGMRPATHTGDSAPRPDYAQIKRILRAYGLSEADASNATQDVRAEVESAR